MKLAEALNLRADLQKRIAQLKERLISNARIQEGEEPAESPDVLMKELDSNLRSLEELCYRINKTNMQTVCGEENLTRMIAAKDSLGLRISVMREVVNEVTIKVNRYSLNEIRFVRTIDVQQLQKEIDTYSKQLRELDTQIQATNWQTDLL